MRIVVNGKPEDVAAEATVAELVDRRGLGKAACAVEVNRKVVPKARHAEHRLAAGDEVEIVTLVGGG